MNHQPWWMTLWSARTAPPPTKVAVAESSGSARPPRLVGIVYSSSNSGAGLLPENSALVSTSPPLNEELVADRPAVVEVVVEVGAEEEHLRAAAIGKIRVRCRRSDSRRVARAEWPRCCTSP